jgi:hypothetical protein
MRTLGTVVVVLSSIALVIACSSSSSSSEIPPPDGGASSGSSGDAAPDAPGDAPADTGSSGSPSVDAACVPFASAYCGYLSRCAPLLLSFVAADEAGCETRIGLACTLSIRSPGAARVPASCTDAIAAAPCDANISALAPSCDLTGALPPSTPCEFDNQCTTGSCWKSGPDTVKCGVCKARATEGQPCTAAKCAYGLACVAGTCIAPKPKDAACNAGECAPPNKCIAGACKPPVAAGVACTPQQGGDDPCDGLRGYFCGLVGAATRCKAVVYADPGAACGVVGTDFVTCKGGLSCVGQPGKCIPNAADGATCDLAAGPKCSAPAECTASRCVLPDPARCK